MLGPMETDAPGVVASSGGLPHPGAPSAVVTLGLTKDFDGLRAVDGLDLDVRRGEVFGFLGPNGAGKTTTVRLLATLLSPSSGTATVAGIPLIPQNGTEIRRRISVMPETPGLYLRLSVEDNLAFFAQLHGLGRLEGERRITAALDAVALVGRRRDLAGTLSKGLRQRVALARALLGDPEVMFLDEPTSGLDPEASKDVRELIVGLRDRDVTVFLTTHRLEEAARLCDRVAIFSRRLRMVGRPDELSTRLFGHTVAVALRQPLPDPDLVFSTVPGVTGWRVSDARYELTVTDASDVAPAVARALVAAGADILRLGEEHHSLEDVYLEVVEDGSR